MRSRALSLLLPVIVCLCALATPAHVGAHPAPAIAAVVVQSDQSFAAVAPASAQPVIQIVATPAPPLRASLDQCRHYAPISTADARLPTVPGVAVGGGSSG